MAHWSIFEILIAWGHFPLKNDFFSQNALTSLCHGLYLYLLPLKNYIYVHYICIWHIIHI